MHSALRVGALLGLATLPVAAAEVVIDSDGRQVQLNGDGTWTLLSKDRFATNAAGQRIRLRADGTWAVVDAGATPAQAPPIRAQADVSLYLARVEIQRKRLKRPKGSHAETRTIYTLRVMNNSARELELPSALAEHLTATSSRGADYPIESVALPGAHLDPGAAADIHVVAVGSPQWFGIKHIALEIAPGTFGAAPRQRLQKSIDEVVRTDVDTFRLPSQRD